MRPLIFAALATALFAAPAVAAPVTPLHLPDAGPDLVQVQDRGRAYGEGRGHFDRGRHYDMRRYGHRSYRPGAYFAPRHHYRSAPRGWHRYHARPYNWRSRGCTTVGPVWFCP